MSLINFEIYIFLTWSEECIIVTGDHDTEKPKFRKLTQKFKF